MERDACAERWQEQQEREQNATEGFVSDRSSVDFAAFWLHYGLTDEESETDQFIQRMQQATEATDRVVLCPWGVLPLVADGVRSTNPWLQLRFHALLEGMHTHMTPPAKLLRLPKDHTTVESRLAHLLAKLGIA